MSFLPFPRAGASLLTGEDLSEPWNCAFSPLSLAPHTSGLFFGPIVTGFSYADVCMVKGGSREALVAQSLPTLATPGHGASTQVWVRVPGAGGIEASCLWQMVKGSHMPGCRTVPGSLGTVSSEQSSQVLILVSRSSHMAPKLALSPATWRLSLFLIKLDSNVEYLFF